MGFYGMPQVFGMSGMPCRYGYRNGQTRADMDIGTALGSGPSDIHIGRALKIEKLKQIRRKVNRK
jgi:hypothetical protein